MHMHMHACMQDFFLSLSLLSQESICMAVGEGGVEICVVERKEMKKVGISAAYLVVQYQ